MAHDEEENLSSIYCMRIRVEWWKFYEKLRKKIKIDYFVGNITFIEFMLCLSYVPKLGQRPKILLSEQQFTNLLRS